MSKAIYTGIGSVARKVKAVYVGVDGLARKVKKGYVGVDGIARLFYSGDSIVYTGDFTSLSGTYAIDGVNHNIYRLTGSGVLTLVESAKVWLCGGGGDGTAGACSASTATAGYGGYGGKVAQGTINKGEYAITIGSAQGDTEIKRGSTSVYSADGGTAYAGNTAGGSYGRANSSSGTNGTSRSGGGQSTYPFGLTALEAHAAGGGGGSAAYTSGPATPKNGYGRDGGTNGGNAGTVGNGSAWGGVKGGGKGGSITGSDGGNASFYGSGGGGGGARYYGQMSTAKNGTAGSGYQGVVYIAVPA